eukprot:CAMPEP_0114663650 /NCGR_PEP_ID=MMETSP0191-20121206/27293_1 /TAXON_ID=126664 /ORGANISM="Sorites sp." /LENGTH=32 /DNA_ID= /DNA_START= /DNA_END= /DNA_ORIENTATION=
MGDTNGLNDSPTSDAYARGLINRLAFLNKTAV